MSHKQFWPSLVHYFDAPDGYLGHFGWLCGYSADSAFLNEAAERFTRQTAGQRAALGQVSLAMMLDPSNQHISLTEAPGVAHLPIREVHERPFKLLHAKVALLGFKHVEKRDDWCIRLLVSTGNWTRQTLEESLDLAWCIDIDRHSQKGSVDIKAAHKMLAWLTQYFDTRLLDAYSAHQPNQTALARQEFAGWVASCSKQAKGPSHFFDNRKKSLLSQLANLITPPNKNPTKRNYLAMGSGFYESAQSKLIPKVPNKIIDTLKRANLLTHQPNIDLFINPRACQAIASSVAVLEEQGIQVRPASAPESIFRKDSSRTLHAKFLFSCNYQERSNTCSSSWVYLGSGNLTAPGFTNTMHPSKGNLEAGVVFLPGKLFWDNENVPEKNTPQVITHLLPIQRETAADNNLPLLSGADMEELEDVFIAAPIAWLYWHAESDRYALKVPDHAELPHDFTVFNSQGQACRRTRTGFVWPDEKQPSQVFCRWTLTANLQHAYLPVMDAFGRLAATQLPALSIDDIFWQLKSFPSAADDGLVEADVHHDVDGLSLHAGLSANALTTSCYPIRQMMELVENIAEQQTNTLEVDWPFWCRRLEQTLEQAKDCQVLRAFKVLELNPVSPLWNAAFRPEFAETNTSKAGLLYEQTLSKIEKSWGVSHLQSIGTAE